MKGADQNQHEGEQRKVVHGRSDQRGDRERKPEES